MSQPTTDLVHSPKTVEGIVGNLAKRKIDSLISPERMIVSAQLALRREPKLLNCTKESFAWALLDGFRAGLEPDGVYATIIARNMKKKGAGPGGKDLYVMEASYMPMYRGLIQTGVDEKAFTSVYAAAVYANDEFDAEYDEASGSLVVKKHRPTIGEPGKIVASYAVFVLPDGRKQVELLRAHDLDKISMASAKRDDRTGEMSVSPLWLNWDEEASRKAAIRRGQKYLARASRRFADLVEMDTRAEIGARSLSADTDDPLTLTPDSPLLDDGDDDDHEPAPKTIDASTRGQIFTLKEVLPLLQAAKSGAERQSVIEKVGISMSPDDTHALIVTAIVFDNIEGGRRPTEGFTEPQLAAYERAKEASR